MGTDIYFISMAARELGMHPQTLRKYERLGLVRPTRSIGSMRLYSADEIQRLRAIKRLVDELRINLAGVRELLSIAEVTEKLREIVQVSPSHPGRERALRREVGKLSELLGL